MRSYIERERVSAQHDRLAVVDQNPVLDVVADRPGKDDVLQIAADPRQVGRPMGVVDPLHCLLDDRPGIEIGDDVMSGSADQLDPQGMGLAVRVGPLNPGRNEWWILMHRPRSGSQALGVSTCM